MTTNENKDKPWPPAGIDWYYSDGSTAIALGDCRLILPHLEPVDLVLTDPPYGIARVWKGGASSGWGKASDATEERNAWDAEAPSAETLAAIISKAPLSIVWGGNYFDLPKSRGWLVWTKPERKITLSEAELAWTNRDTVIRIWDGVRSDYGREHPTQKPINLMKWCISEMLGLDPGTILDPFMGSGTTLRAAKDLGRKCIGIEISREYCEIAVRRLQQEVLPL